MSTRFAALVLGLAAIALVLALVAIALAASELGRRSDRIDRLEERNLALSRQLQAARRDVMRAAAEARREGEAEGRATGRDEAVLELLGRDPEPWQIVRLVRRGPQRYEATTRIGARRCTVSSPAGRPIRAVCRRG